MDLPLRRSSEVDAGTAAVEVDAGTAAVAAARLRTQALGLINRICGTLMLGAAFLLAGKDLDLRQSR